MQQYFKIGKLVAIFGLKGELILRHSLGRKSAFKGLTAVFIEEKSGSFLPYFVKEARIKNESETFLRLDGLDTPEQARNLSQKEIWITEADFKKFALQSAPISLLGYHAYHLGEDLGEIIEVIEQPMQVLCKILIHGKEALIPLHEETLEKIDKAKKRVYLQLPEGLLDIYR